MFKQFVMKVFYEYRLVIAFLLRYTYYSTDGVTCEKIITCNILAYASAGL